MEKRITIKVIPHNEQQYETCGNYRYDGDSWLIEVSDMDNWKYEMLIALHEFVELLLVRDREIPLEIITDFDMKFEKKRKKGNTDEPGDDKNSPYRKEHKFATKIEKMMAKELKVNWNKYDKKVMSL